MKNTTMRRLALGRNQAISLDAVPGTIVRALEGSIWLTQDNAAVSDRILIPGTRFVSGSDGKIVLSSMDGPGVARIYTPDCSGRHAYAGAGLQVDSAAIAAIERAARRARSQELRRLARELGACIASAGRSLARRFGRPAAQHPAEGNARAA